jgi:hypothetical protein
MLMNKPKSSDTIEDAQAYIAENAQKGVKCPCCGLMQKEYHYTINSGQAKALIVIFRLTNQLRPEDGWMHILREFGQHTKLNPQSLSFHRLKLWGLIEQQPTNDDPAKKTSGFWRITPLGKQFVTAKATVKRGVYVLNGEITHYDEEDVDIRGALSEKFSYEQLMGYNTVS